MADDSEGGDTEDDSETPIEVSAVGVPSSLDADPQVIWYPTVDDIVRIHDDIIEEDPDSEPGIGSRDRIQYAVEHIEHGAFGEGPETIHEKAFDLMRLLASNHWFVDGNKRTALNATNLFYFFNGYELEYGEDLRAMLKLLAVREEIIDREVATEYLSEQTETMTITEKIARWLGKIHDDEKIERSDFDGQDADDHND